MKNSLRGLTVIGVFFLLFSFGSGDAAEKKPILSDPKGKVSGWRTQEPLRVNSQHLEADNKNMVITFTGNVVAKQGEMVIYADRAQVFYMKGEAGNEVKEIVATGNVKIQEGDRLATSQKAVFFNAEQKIILTGEPKVWQGQDVVSGDKITVLLEEDKSIVEGSPERRVEVILYPKGTPLGKGKP